MIMTKSNHVNGNNSIGTPKELPSSKVKLSTGLTIAQWGINSNVSLVAIVRPQMMELHSALIEYNVSTFRDAVLAIFALDLEFGG